MGQAIYFTPLNPWRLGVLSEAGVRPCSTTIILPPGNNNNRRCTHGLWMRRHAVVLISSDGTLNGALNGHEKRASADCGTAFAKRPAAAMGLPWKPSWDGLIAV